MKTFKTKVYVLALLAITIVACNKNEVSITDTVPAIPEVLYSPTDYNLDMRNFALAVNEAVNTNKSFRKLLKAEVNKMFDGDFDILLTQIVDSKVDNYVQSEDGTIMRAPGNISVRDLLNSSFQKVKERAAAKGDVISLPQKAPGTSLIDQLTEQYPDLQIAVPFLEEQLENENYIPPVVFLPEEYDEQLTGYLPAIKGDKEYAQSVKIPDYACIVISMSERTLNGVLLESIYKTTTDDVMPPTPTNLQLSETEVGVKLMWNMPAGTNSSNTSGYKIYRTVGSSSLQLYANVSGYINTTFVDVNVTNNVTYSYRVSAFNDYQESDLCDIKSIMPLRPAAAKTFTVEQEALNFVRLNWVFAQNEYSGNVNIYKRPYGSTDNPLVASVPTPNDIYIDNNITPGQKIEYKIERTTGTGTSIPSYDFIYTPYRDMNNYSKVYIRRIKYSDVSKIESGWKGAPEFKIKVLGVTGNTTVERAELFIRLDSRKDDTWTVVGNDRGTVDNYWKPGKTNWYEAYSFYIIEYDGNDTNFNPWEGLTLMAQKFGKQFLDKDSPAWLKGTLELLDVLGKEVPKWCQQEDDKVGYAYLNYYDNPFKTYSTNSAEKGGYLTIQFSDNSNANVFSYQP